MISYSKDNVIAIINKVGKNIENDIIHGIKTGNNDAAHVARLKVLDDVISEIVTKFSED